MFEVKQNILNNAHVKKHNKNQKTFKLNYSGNTEDLNLLIGKEAHVKVKLLLSMQILKMSPNYLKLTL